MERLSPTILTLLFMSPSRKPLANKNNLFDFPIFNGIVDFLASRKVRRPQ